MNSTPQIGQWATIHAVMKKKRVVIVSTTPSPYLDDRITRWEKEPIAPKRALFIGRRNVWNGGWCVTTDEDGDQFYFSRQGYHPVYLFVFDDRRNPVYVRREDVEWEQEVTNGTR